MAITLIMMAAVARAFAFVGERVRDSRGNVSLSSELRDVTTRLNDELRNCTVTLTPVGGNEADPNGYFLYYEGPMTDATTTISGRYNNQIEEGSIVAQDSRFGDLDDYLAFTAISPPGAWFTGQVPAYLLNDALDPSAGSATEVAANTPVVIRSRYAEIVYFVNPERDGLGNIIDADGDLIADRLMLYRRVLLIRPDLNLSTNDTLLRIGATANWLNGMAPVHQVADLSVRRQLNTDGSPGTGVIANSLADLAQPHHRFGHVRIPWGTVSAWGGAGGATGYSMPVLALEDLTVGGLLLSDNGTPPAYRPPPQNTSTTAIAPAATNVPVITPMRMSGYLHRDFVLTGDRRGEDVVANNVRALDVQIFDPTAAFYLSSNGLVVGPSDAGYREVLSGPTSAPIPTAVPGGGFVDLAYPVLAGGATRGWGDLTISRSPSATSGLLTANLEPGGSDSLNVQRMQSTFSGLEFVTGAAAFPTTTSEKTYSNALLKSGRLVIMNGRIVLFQPAFDTYTSAYERDSYYQNRRFNSPLFMGTKWEPFNTADLSITDLAADGIDTNSSLFPGQFGTDDPSERETSAPFLETPQAIRVTVRLENVGTRQLRQMSVVHSDSL
ncbi:hypothetical protein Poly21_39790 [Allorhodopirellula heiligendammensis]|uniref:Uncharacterized protein n=2 Tax=Allorhodopirellula heiligendammensis TaxID=2714739 RepID=A0A5C6BWX7_9BACT|nr:hypothetical protein Poly21_39790 [Allorhodopirellula heiligendammensis]